MKELSEVLQVTLTQKPEAHPTKTDSKQEESITSSTVEEEDYQPRSVMKRTHQHLETIQ